MKSIPLLALVILTGCSAADPTIRDRGEQKARMSITDYCDHQMKHSDLSFGEFRTKMGLKEYYVYVGDRMLGASDYLECPTFASGHSIREIAYHGNRIYAIPIYKYRVGFGPKEEYFWLVAERDGKMYLIANAGMDVKNFKEDFKRPL